MKAHKRNTSGIEVTELEIEVIEIKGIDAYRKNSRSPASVRRGLHKSFNTLHRRVA